MDKLADAREKGRLADGHAPFLSGRELNAYVTAGVVSDHECSQWEEAREKLSRGQWIMVREGTAARNLNALMPMFQYPYCERGLLVTDDKHPGDLIRLGHIDYIIKRAVEQGADPILAIRMGSYNAARYFGLKDRGAIAPGYRADLAVLSDLKTFQVEQVYKDGRLVAEDGEFLGEKPHRPILLPEMEKRVYDSFHMPQIRLSDLEVKETGENQKVICLQDNELLTRRNDCSLERKGRICAGSGFGEGYYKNGCIRAPSRNRTYGTGIFTWIWTEERGCSLQHCPRFP